MSEHAAHEMDEATRHFDEIVEPTAAEFLADSASKRRGVLAALAVASMTEHFFYARQPPTTIAAFKGDLRKENWAIGAIADVANATKHVQPYRGAWGYEDLSIHKLNTAGVMRAGWPLGGREVLVGPDRAWRLSTLIEAGLEFWRQKIGTAERDAAN